MGKATKSKPSYVGAPAIFKLNLACQQINAAYGDLYGCYLVGSALKKPDWRDVDVVFIMPDEDFYREFPDAGTHGQWEANPKWLLHTVAISDWLSRQTGLPIDFKIQPQSWSSDKHSGLRSALGVVIQANKDRKGK